MAGDVKFDAVDEAFDLLCASSLLEDNLTSGKSQSSLSSSSIWFSLLIDKLASVGDSKNEKFVKFTCE